MNTNDINRLADILEKIFDITIEEDELSIISVGDDKYWILPILESCPEMEKLLENKMGFENYEGLWLFKGNEVTIDNKYIYKIKKPELHNSWHNLLNIFLKLKKDLERDFDFLVFNHSLEEVNECIKWHNTPCISEGELKEFIRLLNSIFREKIKCVIGSGYCRGLTNDIKGIFKNRLDFYMHLRNLRTAWQAHYPTDLSDTVKWNERKIGSFKELLDKEYPSEKLDYFDLQYKLIRIGIENFQFLLDNKSRLKSFKMEIKNKYDYWKAKKD
ncbi:MAG: hypothetical protein V5A68_05135 [Candidatus Thermoplasmatota archaeon]